MHRREIYESWDVRVVTSNRECYQHKRLDSAEKTTPGNERKLATGGRPLWPARASCNGGIPAHLRQRHEAWRLHGSTRRLVAGLASPERQRIRRIDRGEPAAALGSAAWSGGAGEGAARLGLGHALGSRPRLYRREGSTWHGAHAEGRRRQRRVRHGHCWPMGFSGPGWAEAGAGRSGSGLRARPKRIG
jgi:hypothetical protein